MRQIKAQIRINDHDQGVASWAWIEISSKQQHEICDVVRQAVRNKGTLAMGMVMGQMSEGERERDRHLPEARLSLLRGLPCITSTVRGQAGRGVRPLLQKVVQGSAKFGDIYSCSCFQFLSGLACGIHTNLGAEPCRL